MMQINDAIWRHQTTACYPGVGVRVQQKCVCDWPYRKISCTETFTMATNNVLPSQWSFIIALCLIKTYWWRTNTANYNDFTWAPWRLKSPATRVFVQRFVQSKIKGNIEAPHYWPIVRETTGDRWFPLTKGQWCGHIVTSSCILRIYMPWFVPGCCFGVLQGHLIALKYKGQTIIIALLNAVWATLF